MTGPFALFSEAWRWWFREFTEMLPALPLAKLLPARRHLLLRASLLETELSVVQAGTCEWRQGIAHPAEGVSTAELRALVEARYRSLISSATALLGPEQVLKAVLHLPKAAARHLDEAVSYQIERISPFMPSNTLYAVRPGTENEASGEIAAEVLITAKDFIEGIQERARALGLGTVAFAIEDTGTGGLKWISFAAQERRSGSSQLGYRVFWAALVFLGGSLMAAPMVSKNRALESTAQEIAHLKPQAEAAGRLRAEREKRFALLAKVAALKRTVPPPLLILAKLSAALDDQSFLFDFRLEGGSVILSGVSNDASLLAQKLGAMPDFKSVKFVGAVTRDTQTPRDRFTLALELAPSS
jgi:general secretion pathway protein L